MLLYLTQNNVVDNLNVKVTFNIVMIIFFKQDFIADV